jgi:predicted molibdopterin-dependent oxidoreductase YjgC
MPVKNDDLNLNENTRAPKSTSPSKVNKPVNNEAIGALIAIEIDKHAIKEPMGTTILEAAKKIGITIPTLCHHEDLCMAGVCRICVVEIEGMRALQAACAYPITSPIKIHTHTRKVRTARRHVLDLLLSNHVGECYACVRNNNCELQALAKEYGVDSFRFGHRTEPRFGKDNSSMMQLAKAMKQKSVCSLTNKCQNRFVSIVVSVSTAVLPVL